MVYFMDTDAIDAHTKQVISYCEKNGWIHGILESGVHDASVRYIATSAAQKAGIPTDVASDFVSCILDSAAKEKNAIVAWVKKNSASLPIPDRNDEESDQILLGMTAVTTIICPPLGFINAISQLAASEHRSNRQAEAVAELRKMQKIPHDGTHSYSSLVARLPIDARPKFISAGINAGQDHDFAHLITTLPNEDITRDMISFIAQEYLAGSFRPTVSEITLMFDLTQDADQKMVILKALSSSGHGQSEVFWKVMNDEHLSGDNEIWNACKAVFAKTGNALADFERMLELSPSSRSKILEMAFQFTNPQLILAAYKKLIGNKDLQTSDALEAASESFGIFIDAKMYGLKNRDIDATASGIFDVINQMPSESRQLFLVKALQTQHFSVALEAFDMLVSNKNMQTEAAWNAARNAFDNIILAHTFRGRGQELNTLIDKIPVEKRMEFVIAARGFRLMPPPTPKRSDVRIARGITWQVRTAAAKLVHF